MSEVPTGNLEFVLGEVRRLGQVLDAIGSERLHRSRLAHAEAILHARRRRDDIFGEGLFGEPAFDILLDLYVALRKGRQVSVSSACIGSGVPPTTALRYIAALEQRGLVERRPDPFDRRRAHLTLSDQAITAMERFLERAP